MAQQIINVGSTPNDGSGDPLRTAYIKCNDNFTELYSTIAIPAHISNGATSVNIPETDGNVEITVNDVANTVLITASGTKITGYMSATGNLSGSNIALTGLATITGNVQAGNLRTAGQVSATGNITGGNVNAGANVYATTHTGTTASLSGNITGGNLLTVGKVSATGNVTGQYIIGDGTFLSNVTAVSNLAVTQIANGTSVFTITGSGANATMTVAGTLMTTFAAAGQYLPGILSVTGNVRGGNISTGGVCQATGNVSGGNISTVGIISSGGNITGANLITSGLVTATGNIDGGNLRTSGLASVGGNVDAGNLRTSGAITATGNIDVGNVNTGNLSLSGNIISAALNASGNINGANLLTTGLISSGGNITGGNLRTSGLISATGNITGGNLSVTNVTGTLLTASQTNITSVGTLSSLNSGTISSSGNVTGANLLTGGLISATGNITGGNVLGGANVNATTHTGTTVSVSGNITGGNVLTGGIMSSTGNATHGNLSVGTGTINVGQIRNTNANGVGNIGASGGYFNTVFALATSAQYADLAEYYVADASYEPGTVVKFGGEFEVTIANTDLDPEVAGVISTCPAYAMNTGVEGSHTVAVALQGRVPTKVIGAVRKGQMMVSAGNGYARAETKPEIGTVIGKALENFDGDRGVIEVVVGRV